MTVSNRRKTDDARDIAAILGISKWTVKNRLMPIITELNLKERILSGDKDAVKELMMSPQVEAFVQRRSLVLEQTAAENVIVNDRGEPIRATDAMRLALWFVDKVGGIDNATKAFSVITTSDLFKKSV